MRDVEWLKAGKNILGDDGYSIEDGMRRYISITLEAETGYGIIFLNRVGERLKFAVLQYIGNSDDDSGSTGEAIWAGEGESGVNKNLTDSYFGDNYGHIKNIDTLLIINASKTLKTLFSNGVDSGE